MELDANSENVTGLLVVCLALVSIAFLVRKKYDSNLPLMFYFVALVFTNMSSMSVNPILLIVGLAFALVVRFEFMSQGFAKLMAYLATAALGLIVYVFLVEIFGTGQAPF
ncbi:MAG TPA: hypothetical protein VMT15_12265 [Bryobacteraceae bacterium]|nr:hypothetical protein [Bryobacteraceae bacterium]